MIIRSSPIDLHALPVQTEQKPVAPTAVASPAARAEVEPISAPVSGHRRRGPEYLPMTGPLPLRFAQPERWPEPLPLPEDDEPTPDEALAEIAYTDPEPMMVVRGKDSREVIDSGTHLRAGSDPAQTDDSMPIGFADDADAGTVAITADMVRGFLDRIDQRGDSLRAIPFRPAVPVRDGIPLAQTGNAP